MTIEAGITVRTGNGRIRVQNFPGERRVCETIVDLHGQLTIDPLIDD